jgi:hypothetical protein
MSDSENAVGCGCAGFCMGCLVTFSATVGIGPCNIFQSDQQKLTKLNPPAQVQVLEQAPKYPTLEQ